MSTAVRPRQRTAAVADGAQPADVRVAAQVGEARSPVFYLEIPPSLFGIVIKGPAGAGLTKSARVVVEKPFGHDEEEAER